ncbi:MAG: YqgE/AlgH family protein [Pseudobdellovibrionaceae bacterium]|nr:YqgE/AlgH family protein [Pseudobdellovibrionaceae bacterium]
MAEQLNLPSLLIALPGLMDPHFVKSVVLLIQHNPDGALGFVVNRPMPMSLRDMVFQNRYQIPNHVPVWMGGPIGSNQGLVIHNQGGDIAATASSGDLRVSSSEEAVDGLVQHIENVAAQGQKKGEHLLPYRFVIGYCGWGPKQLDLELKSGHWYQKPLDFNLLFNTPWQEIWSRAVAELGVHPIDIAPNIQSYMN